MQEERRWLPPLALAYLSFSWVAGVYLGSVLDMPWLLALAAIPLLALFPFLPAKRRPLLFFLGLCLAAAVAGAARYSTGNPQPGGQSIARFNDSGSQTVSGVISQEPEAGGASQTMRIEVDGITEREAWSEASGNLLIRLRPYPEYHKGDRLELTGKLKSLSSMSGPSSPSYRAYLERQGISALMDYPRVRRLSEGSRGPFDWLLAARSHLSAAIGSALPEPQASLGQAILLGERKDIPGFLNRAFSRTGTAHLLAVSGMNVSIAAGLLVAIGLWLFGRRRFLYVWFAIAGVWTYAALTGMFPPVLRAAIMATVFLLSEYSGRQGSAIVALSLAAAVMVGIEPPVLWTVSFQLSFASMAGLILLAPILQRLWLAAVASAADRYTFLHQALNFIVVSTAVTLGTMLSTLPLLALYFGLVSVVSLPANLAIVLAMPVIMLSTGVVAVLGVFSASLGWLTAWVAWPFLTYVIEVVQMFDRFPNAAWTVPSVPLWIVAAYYLVIAGCLQILSMPSLKRLARHWSGGWSAGRPHQDLDWTVTAARWSALCLLSASIFLWTAASGVRHDRLRVNFLDVGNGEAILISSPAGRHVLIDGGPDARALKQQLGNAMPFWARGLDLVVVTQPLAGHLTGLLGIVDSYRVGQVIELDRPYDSSAYREWKKRVADRRIPVQAASAGQTVDLGQGARLRVLHAGVSASRKASAPALVLRLEWGETSFLLTSDAGKDIELELLETRSAGRTTVLKVAARGSAASTSAELLAAVRPAIAVVPGGRNNQGLPSRQVMDRLSGQLGEDYVFSTAERGTVTVVSDSRQVWVETEK